MTKGQKKSSREAKKPKKSAAQKSAAGGISGSLDIVPIQRPAAPIRSASKSATMPRDKDPKAHV